VVISVADAVCMAGRCRPKADLALHDEERDTLRRWSARRSSAQALRLRCRIVLACAESLSNAEVAVRLGSPGRWWVSGGRGWSSTGWTVDR
jgi:hypothetical protein